MQVLPQTAKTLLQSSAKARRYFKNKVLEIQKCHDILSDSHSVYPQTRITDTTHGFFPSGATAMLCNLFLLIQLDIKYELMLLARILCTDPSAEPSQQAAVCRHTEKTTDRAELLPALAACVTLHARRSQVMQP